MFLLLVAAGTIKNRLTPKERPAYSLMQVKLPREWSR